MQQPVRLLIGVMGPLLTIATPAHAATDYKTLSCQENYSLPVKTGIRLINNTWNKGAAGSFSWSQCLEKRNGPSAFGWSWKWPNPGAAVYAYPSFLIGYSPWAEVSTTDRRLPRSILSTSSFKLKFDSAITTNGSYNIAADIWLTRKPSPGKMPGPKEIATELMIWTYYTPDMVANTSGLTKISSNVYIDGRQWTLWGSRNWGSPDAPTRWTYLAYIANTKTRSAAYDIRKFIADGITRGWITHDQYISDVELGTELVSGTGRIWFPTLSYELR